METEREKRYYAAQREQKKLDIFGKKKMNLDAINRKNLDKNKG